MDLCKSSSFQLRGYNRFGEEIIVLMCWATPNKREAIVNP